MSTLPKSAATAALFFFLAACDRKPAPAPPSPPAPVYVDVSRDEMEPNAYNLGVLSEAAARPDQEGLSEAFAKFSIPAGEQAAWRAVGRGKWDEAAAVGSDARVPLAEALAATIMTVDKPRTRAVLKAWMSVATAADAPAARRIIDGVETGSYNWWNDGEPRRGIVLAAWKEMFAWLGDHGGPADAALLTSFTSSELSERAEMSRPALHRLVARLQARRSPNRSTPLRAAVAFHVAAHWAKRRQIEPVLLDQFRKAGLDLAAADASNVDVIVDVLYDEESAGGQSLNDLGTYDLAGTVAVVRIVALNLASGKIAFDEHVSRTASNLPVNLKQDELEEAAHLQAVELLESSPEFKELGKDLAEALAAE